MTGEAPLPLEGVRVLDLTRLLPGPFCAQVLGDFGADVVKVEAMGVGDPVRLAPPYAGPSTSGPFLMVNRNKRSIAVDLKRDGGKAVMRRLAERADVLLEGFRPGVLDRLGLGYDALSALNPRLVYCAITGYGQDGPLRTHAGHDIDYLAYAGVLGMTGPEDGPPVVPGVQVADLTGALYGVIGTLLALRARETTGRGQLVDVSMLDGALSLLTIHAGAALYGDAPVRGRFPLSGALPNYGIYRTKDARYVAVGALEPHFFARLLATLGLDEHAGAIAAVTDGPEAGAEAKEAIARAFAERTLAEWREVLEGSDACVAPILTVEEALEGEQARARGMRRAMPHDELGLIHQIAPAVRLSETPGTLRRSPPALGGHTDEVLAEAGFSEDEVAALRGEGAVG